MSILYKCWKMSLEKQKKKTLKCNNNVEYIICSTNLYQWYLIDDNEAHVDLGIERLFHFSFQSKTVIEPIFFSLLFFFK